MLIVVCCVLCVVWLLYFVFVFISCQRGLFWLYDLALASCPVNCYLLLCVVVVLLLVCVMCCCCVKYELLYWY